MSLTALAIRGPYSSTCGYCSGSGQRSSAYSSHGYGVQLEEGLLPCSEYLEMCDRGWRRSGLFIYKPDMKRTCCPQYPIRLDALNLYPSRSQREATNRWTRFVLYGDKKADAISDEKTNKGKDKTNSRLPPFDLVTSIHSSESAFISDTSPRPAHKFEVTLEPPRFTLEKFNLYLAYQRDIHKDSASPDGFNRFLVISPLREEPIPYSTTPSAHLPKHYGAYHQCYRVDGELFAMAVLDILPGCVSSVYFMYDKKWERFSLGKISALREAALAREIYDAGIQCMKYLYLGFYIHTCPKMRYKADYAPSYLLDPEEYVWFPIEECTAVLNKYRYSCFSKPEHSLQDDPGPQETEEVPSAVLSQVFATLRRRSMNLPVNKHPLWRHNHFRKLIVDGINALGYVLAQRMLFVLA